MPVIPLGRLRQENHLNLGDGGCSELRLHHCTPAWATEQDSVSKKKKERKKERKERKRNFTHWVGHWRSFFSFGKALFIISWTIFFPPFSLFSLSVIPIHLFSQVAAPFNNLTSSVFLYIWSTVI